MLADVQIKYQDRHTRNVNLGKKDLCKFLITFKYIF